jgi:hypothetical protein
MYQFDLISLTSLAIFRLSAYNLATAQHRSGHKLSLGDTMPIAHAFFTKAAEILEKDPRVALLVEMDNHTLTLTNLSVELSASEKGRTYHIEYKGDAPYPNALNVNYARSARWVPRSPTR